MFNFKNLWFVFILKKLKIAQKNKKKIKLSIHASWSHIGGTGVYLHSFLTSVLERGESEQMMS